MCKTKKYPSSQSPVPSSKGFTLIEILIAVTISTLLMVSVMVFIWSSLKSNTKSQKILVSLNSNSDFEQKLLDMVNTISWSWVMMSWSLFSNYGNSIFLSTSNPWSPIAFIWIKTSTGYCDAYWTSATQTWTVQKLILKELLPANSHQTSWWYSIDWGNSSVIQGWIRVIWTWNAWDSITQNTPLATELSSPNAIFYSSWFLYIADSGNNRILAYDTLLKKIDVVADSTNGIYSPTDIYLTGSKLYVANSWKWNIITLKDGSAASGNNPVFNFKLTRNLNVDGIQIEFDWISNVISPINASDFSFSWITSNLWDSVLTWTTLTYSFTWWRNLNKNVSYWIGINNLGTLPTLNWNYSARMDFMFSWSSIYSEYLPYYSIWDSSIYHSTWNTLEVLTGWLNYPNNITWPLSWDDNITDWNSMLSSGNSRDTESKLPISGLDYSVNNWILTIKYTYYKHYDCLNWNHILKERVLKRKLN